MAQGKKSFVAYADWKEIFDELPNEQAGELIKHIFSYVNDENPTTDSVLIRAVFANIKSTLKRDLDKWESQLEQRRKAGKRSAEIRSTKINEPLTVVEIRRRNPTVSDSVSVSDNVNNTIPTKEEFVAYGLSKVSDVSVEALGLKYEAWLSNDWCTNKAGKEQKIKNWKSTLNNTLAYLPKQPKQQKSIEQIQYEHVMKQMELNK